MEVDEDLAVVVDLAVVLVMVFMDAYVAEVGEFLTPLISLHLIVYILKLKLSNILKKHLGSCLHNRNINFFI